VALSIFMSTPQQQQQQDEEKEDDDDDDEGTRISNKGKLI
jgi:hypothetical protein